MDSKLYRAIVDLKTALQSCRVDDGFNFDVDAASVLLDPADLTKFSGPLPVYLIGVPELTIARTYENAQQIREVISVSVFVRMDTASDVPQDGEKWEIAAKLFADTERALMGNRPGADWPANIQRDGTAIDTRLKQSAAPFSDIAGPQVFVEIPIEIRMNPRPVGAP